jgi:hypothetical protein
LKRSEAGGVRCGCVAGLALGSVEARRDDGQGTSLAFQLGLRACEAVLEAFAFTSCRF